MKPRNTIFKPDIARQKMSIVADARASLLCGHSLDREISSLAENVAAQIDILLLLDQLASVASQPSLIRS